MRWDDLPKSDNIDDRRSDENSGVSPGGFNLPGGRGSLSIGTVVVLGLVGWALGIDPSLLIGGAEILTGNPPQQHEQQTRAPHPTVQPTDDSGRFVAAVLGSADVQWTQLLSEQGRTYQRPRLVLFNRVTHSACGVAQSAMGPFYCPNDREIYLDTSFFAELEQRFRGCSGNACQFAQAYVIAHEVGHHVQNQLGILAKAHQAQSAAPSKVAANAIQVKIELQADCFAGVWAFHADKKWKFMEPGDVEAALQTASAIGDDMLQRQTQGRVVPESFTHGSAEQRKRWFTTGWKNGTIAACDTFNASQL